MAYSFSQYSADGINSIYTVGFPFLQQSHVVVTVGGVEKTVDIDYVWPTASTIQLLSVPPAGTLIDIRRFSNRDTRLVNYQDGSTLTEALLDEDGNQVFYMAQEALDKTITNIGQSLSDAQWDAQGKRIRNVGTPIADADAVNQYWANHDLTTSVLAQATANTAALTAAAIAAQAAAEAAATTATAAAASIEGLSMTGMGLADGTAYDLGLVADALTLYLTDCGTLP